MPWPVACKPSPGLIKKVTGGCDIPTQLYSFEFAPNPGWSRTFA